MFYQNLFELLFCQNNGGKSSLERRKQVFFQQGKKGRLLPPTFLFGHITKLQPSQVLLPSDFCRKQPEGEKGERGQNVKNGPLKYKKRDQDFT